MSDAGGPYGSGCGGAFRFVPILLGLLGAFFLVARGCQEGPFGRRQIVALNPQQEAELGAQAFQQVLAKERGKLVPGDEPITGTVDRIARQLINAANEPQVLEHLHIQKPNFAWKTVVVRSREV